MDVEHKKTALKDDSAIYQSRDNTFGKKDIRSLSKKQKLEYFKDYYLMKVIVILAVVVFVVVFLNASVFNRSECILSIALLNESQIMEHEALNEAIEDYLVIQGKNDYTSVENYNLDDAQMQMAYVAKNAAGAIDVVICTQEYFEKEAVRGMFADLSGILTEDMQGELSGRLLEAQEVKDEDDEGNILSYYDPCPYGIDISGSAHFEEFGGNTDKLVLSVTQGAVNTENIIKIITYFMEGTK